MIATISLVALIASLMIILAVGPYAGRMQSVTLWAGKKIAPEGMEKEAPNGFQDAITPKLQVHFNTILPISYLLVLISGSILKWYLGILSLIVAVLIMAFIQRFVSAKICRYLLPIIHAMDNREADYAKENDKMRSEAAAEMAEKLKDLYSQIREDDPEIPSFDDIKKMPLG